MRFLKSTWKAASGSPQASPSLRSSAHRLRLGLRPCWAVSRSPDVTKASRTTASKETGSHVNASLGQPCKYRVNAFMIRACGPAVTLNRSACRGRSRNMTDESDLMAVTITRAGLRSVGLHLGGRLRRTRIRRRRRRGFDGADRHLDLLTHVGLQIDRRSAAIESGVRRDVVFHLLPGRADGCPARSVGVNAGRRVRQPVGFWCGTGPKTARHQPWCCAPTCSATCRLLGVKIDEED